MSDLCKKSLASTLTDNFFHIRCSLFFAISAFFEILCVLLYAFIFPKLLIVKYYRSQAALEGSKTVSADLAAGGIQKLPGQNEENKKQHERLGNKALLLQNIDYALDMFLIYALTLSIFPGFLSEDTGKHSLGRWYALVLIAMYNVCDLIGRYIPLIECLKVESQKYIMVSILCRFSLLPAFYFTARNGDQGWMIMLTSILGLSNGYLTVCVLTAAPKGYKGPEQNALGNLLVLFLTGGIFAEVKDGELTAISRRAQYLTRFQVNVCIFNLFFFQCGHVVPIVGINFAWLSSKFSQKF